MREYKFSLIFIFGLFTLNFLLPQFCFAGGGEYDFPDDTGEAVIVAPELPTNEPPASTGAEGSGDETPAASRRRGIIRRGRAK